MDTTNTTHKIVVVVNEKIASGVAFNAGFQMALGLAARAVQEQPAAFQEMRFLNYQDKDGSDHPFISALSLIVLRGTSSEIRKLRRGVQAQGLLYVDFHHQMTGETFIEQLERSTQTFEADLQYYGICALGSRADLDPLTRKFSLWK